MRDNESIVTCFGQPMKVNCDRNCAKAWGINSRPRVGNLTPDDEGYDEADFAPDAELGIAPVDPGTYEGSDAKPLSPDEFPNKWCVRECERCNSSEPGEFGEPLEILKF